MNIDSCETLRVEDLHNVEVVTVALGCVICTSMRLFGDLHNVKPVQRHVIDRCDRLFFFAP